MSINTYQFEPVRKYKEKTNLTSDYEWEDIEDGLDTSEDVGENPADRVYSEPLTWCICSACKTMPVNRECLCCTEIDEIKFKKLSDGMIFIFRSIYL